MHTGMSNVWRAHFGNPIISGQEVPGEDAAFLNSYLTRAHSLRADTEVLRKVLTEGRPVRIGTTAGGISAFHRSVFDKSGGYDEIFNPFGYEDSEFGFRTQSAGHNHYLVSSCAAIHDLFVSGQNRSVMYAPRIGLLRGVEAGGQWVNATQRSYALRQSLLYGVKSLVANFAREAKSQPGYLPQLKAMLPSALASYGFEFARGLMHSAHRGAAADLAALAALFQPGPTETCGFALPLDENVSFNIGRLIKRGDLPLAPDNRFSLHGFNCHIAEQSGEMLLQSRHFDVSIQVRRHGATDEHSLQLDILSDDVLHKLEIGFTLNFSGAAQEGILRITNFKTQTKAHDYGSFSVEDIYPTPRLYESPSWLQMVERELAATAAINPAFGLQTVIGALIRYLRLGQPAASALPISGSPVAPATSPAHRKRVLIFTDSRGQHKPAGDSHKMFAERLAEDSRLEVETRLCPMKWTTTLDFLAHFDAAQIAGYDHVILYTGIVDWSPRRLSNARDDLYDNRNSTHSDAWNLNTTNYARKVVNNKKATFDNVFGADEMARHFAAHFTTVFEGEPSINMYRLSAARERLIPRLAAMSNLIFINANRIARGWKGDYPRERPANMDIIHDYSRAFAEAFPGERLVDLMEWSEEDVKIMTCDNLHLTEAGNAYIHNALLKRIFATEKFSETVGEVDGGARSNGWRKAGAGNTGVTLADRYEANAGQTTPALFLSRAAAELLLKPGVTLRQIDGPLAANIADCLTHAGQDDPVRKHFVDVLNFTRGRTTTR